MTEYNERYIGEVFIDGKSNKLLQEFLTNLFNSYNGEGKGFDADMVDGWHRDDILKYVDDGLDTKLDYIKIGTTVFDKSNPENYINFYDMIYQFVVSEDVENEVEMEPWITKILNDAENNGNDRYHRNDSSLFDPDGYYFAQDVIRDVYTVLDRDKVDEDVFIELLNNFNELKDDFDDLSEDYENFKNRFANVFKKVKIIDNDGNEVEKCLLNADLINGFRIIPITQAAYNALPDSQKDYWRNIYIIVDEVPDEYEDPIQFRVLEGIKLVYNPETQYIDYYNGISPDPKPLISLVDLLSGANFNQHIRTFLENTEDVIYNTVSLKESLKEVSIEDGEDADFDFLTKNEASVLASSIVVDSGTGTITSSRNPQGFTTFNITQAFKNKFNAVSTEINNFRSEVASNYVKQQVYNNKMNSIDNAINTLTSQYNSDITDIRERMYRNGLIVTVGRWYDKGGELGTRLQLYNNNPNSAGVQNGLYVRVMSDRPIDHNKLNIIIDLEPLNKAYTFNNSDSDTTHNITKVDGMYYPFGKDTNGNYIGPSYYSAMTTMFGINQPSWEKGKKFLAVVIVRYGEDAFPISVTKRIEILGG